MVLCKLTRLKGHALRLECPARGLHRLAGSPASTAGAHGAGAASPLVPANIITVADGITANSSGLITSESLRRSCKMLSFVACDKPCTVRHPTMQACIVPARALAAARLAGDRMEVARTKQLCRQNVCGLRPCWCLLYAEAGQLCDLSKATGLEHPPVLSWQLLPCHHQTQLCASISRRPETFQLPVHIAAW